MFEELDEAAALFDRTVPHGEEVFMVLKAHLMIETALVAFVKARTPDAIDFHKQVLGGDSPCRNGFGLILLAQALSMRDEVPQTHADVVWPALKLLNRIRNNLAHELSPDHGKLQRRMHEFCNAVFPKGVESVESDVNRAFHKCAGLLLVYLHIDKHPLWQDDEM